MKKHSAWIPTTMPVNSLERYLPQFLAITDEFHAKCRGKAIKKFVGFLMKFAEVGESFEEEL